MAGTLNVLYVNGEGYKEFIEELEKFQSLVLSIDSPETNSAVRLHIGEASHLVNSINALNKDVREGIIFKISSHRTFV